MRGYPFLLLRGTTFARSRPPDTQWREISDTRQLLIAPLRPIAWQMRRPSSSSEIALGILLNPELLSIISVAIPAVPSKFPAASPVGPAPTITIGMDSSA